MTIEMRVSGAIKSKPSIITQGRKISAKLEITSITQWIDAGQTRQKEETITVLAWGRAAEHCKGLNAGDIIAAIGTPRNKIEWINGQPTSVQEVKATQVHLLAKMPQEDYGAGIGSLQDEGYSVSPETGESWTSNKMPAALPCYQYSGVKAS